MNALTALRRVRAVLATGVLARAVAWGVAAALTLIVGAALADWRAPVPMDVRALVIVIAALAAVVVAAALVWRDRAVWRLDRVALWMEEHVPSLEYALLTAVTSGDASFVASAHSESWLGIAFRRVARVLGVPAAALAVAAVVVMLLPAGAVARVRSPHAGDSLDRRAGAAGAGSSRLTPLVAEVVPPAYSGERSTTVDEPTDVRALAGSALTLRGRGDGGSVIAVVGHDTVRAATRGNRWEIGLRVGQRAAALELSDRDFHRIIGVEPIADAPPSVTLAAPAHDTVLRVPRGRIPLAAEAADDFGIASASFEVIVSSGEGESFTFKSGTLGAVRPASMRVSLAASLSIDSLALRPGDIVHLRAVARDANDVTGPGVGTSDTRTIRIARADEYDSVAVDAAAPSEAEKGAISQRMLIILAEALEKKRPSLPRATLLAESHSIAVDQTKLRRAVGDVVFTRLSGDPSGEERSGADSPTRAKNMEELLARADSATTRSADPIDFEGGESPVVAVNKPLLEAYNAMWDASTSLEMGEPARALPHMRRALAAIQKARQAERLYLRGTPPTVIVDVSKVRLTGKDKGSPSARRGVRAVDSVSAARADRFARLVELAARDAHAAADSLLVLRIDALTDNPPFAAALSDAVRAIHAGRGSEATTALVRARRALAGVPAVRDSLARWGVVP